MRLLEHQSGVNYLQNCDCREENKILEPKKKKKCVEKKFVLNWKAL